MLEIGTKAPAFKLPDQNGEMHTLEEYKGKKVILYFIPEIIHRDAQSRHAALESFILSLQKKGRSFWG